MNLDELTLGDIKTLQALFSSTAIKNEPLVDCGIRIVILQRGWVMVGHLYQKGSECYLEGCNVIRRWGSTDGLGELATKGPLTETKLEPTPRTSFHELTIIATIECERSRWPDIK